MPDPDARIPAQPEHGKKIEGVVPLDNASKHAGDFGDGDVRGPMWPIFLVAVTAIVLLLARRLSSSTQTSQRYVSSVSTMIGGQRVQDGALLLWTIALFAPTGTKVFVASDKPTIDWFEMRMPSLMQTLDISWSYSLDGYNMTMQRGDMIKTGVWSDFQMEKARIMEYALTQVNDTVFLDADCMVLSPIPLPPLSSGAQMGLSPHYMRVLDSRDYGFFNGGLAWTNQASMPRDWIAATRVSRYYDQTALEDLAEWYRTYLFGTETDLGWWRIKHGEESEDSFWRKIKLDSQERIAFNGKPVDTTHAHFLTADHGNSESFVSGILNLMKRSRRYSELLSIIDWGRRDFLPPVPRVAFVGIGARSNRRRETEEDY